MALNQMIAQGAQFNMPDPVAQYAKMQQLQAVQNQNALAQYQLGSAQRGDVQKNALNQAYSQGVDPATGQLDYKKVSAALAAAGAGSQIPAALKQQFETQKAEAELSKTTGEVRGQQQKEIDAIARNLSQNPDDESILASKDIIQKSSFYSPEAKAKALAVFDRALSIPVTERGSYFGMQGATAGERATANRPVAVGGSLMSPTGQTLANAPEPGFTLSPGQVRYPKGYAGVVSAPAAATAAAKPPEKLEIMRALGYSMDAVGDAAYEAAKRAPPTVAAPPVAIGEMRSLGIPETPEGFAYYNELKTKTPVAAPPSMVAEYTFAKTPEGGNFKGTYQQFVTARAAAGRAPAAPRAEPAPTLDTVVDPNNPNQMLRIDVRRYSPGGSVGSPGVIGISGKEPGAAVRENKAEAGKTQLADDLENLRASFLVLDKIRAIPSTERNPLSNLASFTAASGVGQLAGRAFSTEAQVEREVINSARTRLVNSIKNATGMSAQQLNSNVELQTMLKSISDPAQPVQAALRIIEDIENAYVKGAGMSKKKATGGGGAPVPTAAAGVAPPPGFKRD
jgi:hypothetical protein